MRFAFISAFASLAIGCSSTNSGNLPTNQIKATLTVTSSGNGETDLLAILQDGASYVKLSGGDQLVAIQGSGPVDAGVADAGIADAGTVDAGGLELTESDLYGQVTYAGDFLESVPGTLYSIDFDRTSGKTDALSSVVLPSEFDLSLSGGTSTMISRSMDSINFTWDTTPLPDELMVWSATGGCIVSANGDILIETPNGNSYSIPPGTLQSNTSNTTSASMECEVTVAVSREITSVGATGSSGPGWMLGPWASGSSITGVQTRTATILTGP